MNHFEIEACVIRAKNGNKAELLKLLEQYKPYIIKEASKYNIPGWDLYDLIQSSYITLIHAVEKYKKGSNRFGSYAFTAISNNLRYVARENLKGQIPFSLDAEISTGEDNSSRFVDMLESPENVEEDVLTAERLREVRKAVSKLPFDEMQLVIMVYYTGMSLRTYAQKTGISYSTALRKRDRILKKLRVEL
jgi:RNA polymerase sigma factor, sigma-70 family